MIRPSETTRVLVTGEETGGRFAIVELREAGGAAPPRHVHAHEDEVIYVLDGHLIFGLGDDLLDAPTGACVPLLRGTEYAYRVVSHEARLLVMVVPAGIEGYYREMGRHDALPSDVPEIERLVSTAARYGVAITGPGLPTLPRNGE